MFGRCSTGSIFDVVVMNHVLEHLENPLRFLEEVRKRMAPRALLHVAVPNIRALSARLPGWTSYEPYHLTYFNPQTLRNTVESAGFTVEFEATHESFSGWYLAVLRTVMGTYKLDADNRVKRKTSSSGSMAEHAYRIGMISAGLLTFPIRLIQSRMGLGDEAIVIARLMKDAG